MLFGSAPLKMYFKKKRKTFKDLFFFLTVELYIWHRKDLGPLGFFFLPALGWGGVGTIRLQESYF